MTTPKQSKDVDSSQESRPSMSKNCEHLWSYLTYYTDPNNIVSKKICFYCTNVEEA